MLLEFRICPPSSLLVTAPCTWARGDQDPRFSHLGASTLQPNAAASVTQADGESLLILQTLHLF